MTQVKAYTGDEPYIFVSYSHRDGQVQSILQEMSSNGYRIWYDEGIQSGRAWADVIARRIKGCCQFVVLLTHNAVRSDNVKDEIHLAVKYKLNMQLVFLEELQLEDGLELQLDRKQAIYRYRYSTEIDFYGKLLQGLATEALSGDHRAASTARVMLEQEYEIVEPVSEKMNSGSYKGIKKRSGIPVFIKRISFADSIFGSAMKQAVQGEIRILEELQQQNCPFSPTLMDYFMDSNNVFIVEQYLGGASLANVLPTIDRKDPAVLQDRCIAIIINVAKALRYLHHAPSPIVHRDIKPHNMMISAYDDVYLVDFGICLRYREQKPQTYSCLGTVGYAAPEQYNATQIPDERSDIYGLGILLLQLLTEMDPIRLAHRSAGPLRYYDSRLEPSLENIILKMTAENASDRYGSVEEVITALQNYKISNWLTRAKLLRQSNAKVRAYTLQLEEEKNKAKQQTAEPVAVPQFKMTVVPGQGVTMEDGAETSILEFYVNKNTDVLPMRDE